MALDYGYVLFPHVINALLEDWSVDGCDISISLPNITINTPCTINYRGATWSLAAPKTFTVDTSAKPKWVAIYFDPAVGDILMAEGAVEQPSCLDYANPFTCIRPRPPKTPSTTLYLVPVF